VKADIAAWKPKAKHWIAGHDYAAFPGVKQAVDEAFPGCTVQGNVWFQRL
jgi:hypothetical protein